MNKNHYTILDSAASLHIPDDLDLFPQVKAQLDQRRTFMQTLRARPALAIMLAILALLLLTGVAYAIGRSLGYIPGIGFVEQGTKIRVLAEPVSQTREAVTVTIEEIVVDSERMVIIYKTEGLTIAAANSKGELGVPLPPPLSLRLPDGTLLQENHALGYGTPEPLLNDLTTEGGWPNYVTRIVFPAVDSQTNELTLLIPLLQNMPTEAAPENWEITFQLKPAPADMNVAPILQLSTQVQPETIGTPLAGTTDAGMLSNTATLDGVTLSLDSVIEMENGFVFTGKIKWDASPFPPNKGLGINFSEILTLSDGNGQNVPIEEVELDAAYDNEHERLWSFRTNRKSFVGPLVFTISSLKGMYSPPPFEFDFDLGPNPQVGQTWEVNREFQTGNQVIRVLSAQLVENKSDGDTKYCLVFDLENIDWGGIVEDLNSEPVGRGCYDADGVSYGGSGHGDKPINISSQEVSYPNIPSGLRHFSLHAFADYTLPGPWQVAWNPPASSEPIPTLAPEACLTLDKWNQLLAQNESDALPADMGGKVVTSVSEDGNFPAIYISSLDGTNSQRIDTGSSPSLSRDGTRLVYSAGDRLRIVDLATGQNTMLVTEGYDPIWSPDSTRILYTTFSNLHVINADGSGLQTIDTGSADSISSVGWLPDNQTIIYATLGGAGFNFKSHNLQTGEVKDLFVANNKAGFGSISPDGQWIISMDRTFGANAPVTFIARIGGSGRRLIEAPEVMGATFRAWSPDGQWLLFDAYDREDDEFHILVNPFTCQVLRANTINGMVEDWGP